MRRNLGFTIALSLMVGGFRGASADPLNLDLGSDARSLPASSLGLSDGITITQQGQNRTIGSEDLLTAGEFVAATQAVAGNQSLQVNASGVATGGTFNVSSLPQGVVGNLMVPTGVTAIQNAAQGQFSIIGNFTNSGIFYALTSDQSINSSVLSANSIINNSGALISSVAPASLPTFFSVSNLNLIAAGDIINAGSIVSAGSLNLQAGGSITNGTAALLQSTGALNLTALSGVFQNAGLISSITGDVNFSAAQSHINFLNTGGRVEGLMGGINFRNLLFDGNANLSLTGGDFAARELNLHSGCGVVQAQLAEVIGTVNIWGRESHISAASQNLTLGSINLTGDPTFYNSSGDVTFASNLVFSGTSLAIIASRDIIAMPGASLIDTSSATANGGQILLVAGASFSVTGPASSLPPASDTTSTLTIYGASATGGKIDLASNTQVNITSTGGGVSGNGGNVSLIAYTGFGADAGKIILPAAGTITSGGSGTGMNGNVQVLAEIPCPLSITLGNVDTRGGSGTGGNIDVRTATVAPGTVTVLNGSVTSGAFVAGASVAGDIAAGNLISGGGGVSIATNGNAVISGINADGNANRTGGAVVINSGANAVFTVGSASTNGVSGQITSRGGPVAGSGGSVDISALSIALSAGSLNVNSSPASGDGGTIKLNAISDLTSAGGLAADATAGKGGTLDLRAQNMTISGNLSASGSSDGGSVKAFARNLFVAGSVAANAGNTGKGGSIDITSASGGTFLVDPSAVANGISGTVTARGGSTAGDGGSISIAGEPFTFTSMSIPDPSRLSVSTASGKGGRISLTTASWATQSITLGAGSLSVDGFGNADGGQITVSTGILNVAGGSLALSANGSGTGNAGSITVRTADATTDLRVDNVVGGITFSATSGVTSGNGGTVVVDAGRDLYVNPAFLNVGPQGANGNGGSITLDGGSTASPGMVFVSGNLSANGAGTGNGGSISITCNRTTTFAVGPGAAVNGINGFLTAQAGALSGNGGSISLTNFSQNNSGIVGLQVLDSAAIDVAASPGGGNGGNIAISTKNGFFGTPGRLIMAPGTYAATASGSGNGGSISLTGGQIFGSYTLDSSAAGTGNGGSISITATSLFGNQTTIANGAGTGNGGTVSVGSTNSGLYFGPGGSIITANSGLLGGNGGSINLSSQGLSIDTSGLSANPQGPSGGGGSYSLLGRDYLQITGDIHADGVGAGNGGVISLSLSPFVFLPVASLTLGAFDPFSSYVNGVLTANAGAASGNGGSVTVRTNRSTITLANTGVATANASPGGGSAGTIYIGTNLSSGTGFGPGDYNVTIPSGIISAPGTGTSGNGGSILLAADNLIVTGAGPLTLAADASGSGNGGRVIVQTRNGPLTVGPGAGQLVISVLGGSAGSAAGNGGQATVRSRANQVIVDPAFISVAPQGLNGNGGTFYFSGMRVFVSGSLIADGVGIGDGGQVEVLTNSVFDLVIGPAATDNGVAGVIRANAGNMGGKGGYVSIGNNMGGSALQLDDPSNITLNATGGDGGYLQIEIRGMLNIGTGSLSVAAAGQGNGGTLNLLGSGISITGGGTLDLFASGAGTGNGGLLDVEMLYGTGPVPVGSAPGQITLTTTGGSSGSVAGNGGTIYVYSRNVTTIDADAIDVRPLGTNGGGGVVLIDTEGTLNLSGTLDVRPVGSGTRGRANIDVAFGNTNFSGTLLAGGSRAVINNDNGSAFYSGIIDANGIGTGGAGGEVRIQTQSAGNNISFDPGFVLRANATGSGNLAGGPLLISARGNINFLGAATVSANGIDSGSGGTITITPGNGLAVTAAGPVSITASGGTTGNGGSISMTSSAPLIIDVANFSFAATGGSAGAAQGNGGTITLRSTAGSIAGSGTALDVRPLGLSGAGGNISLTSASSLAITGNLDAHANGQGNGGTVTLSYNSPGVFVVGGTLVTNGVSGSILADANIGSGGSIIITNAAPLSISLGGDLTAGSVYGGTGFVTLQGQLNQPVSVVGPGKFDGRLQILNSPQSVTINPQAGNSIIEVSNIVTSGGPISIISPAAGSMVGIIRGGVLRATNGAISIESPFFSNLGTLATTANNNLTIKSDYISYCNCLASVSAGTGTLTLAPVTNVPIYVAAANNREVGITISATELAQTTAGTLVLGDINRNGSITVAGNMNVSGAGAGAFNLVYLSGGSYSAAGTSTTLGSRTLSSTALSTTSTGAISGTNTSVSFTSGGTTTIDGVVDIAGVGTVSIVESAGGNGGINISANVGATTVNLIANGTGSILRTAGTVSGTNLTMSSGTGEIGTTAANIFTSVTNVIASTGGTGSVHIFETDTVVVGPSSAGDIFELTVGANYTTAGLTTVTADDLILHTTAASNGNIDVNASLTFPSSITLDAGGSGSITETAGVLTSNRINLYSGTGDIGQVGSPIQISTNILEARTQGSVYVSEVDGLSLAASQAGGTFSLSAPVSVTTLGNTGATDGIFNTPLLANNFALSGTASFTVATPGSLNVSGTGTISAPAMTFNGPGGTVNVSQNQLNGIASGTAGLSFSATALTNNLFGGTIAANGGSILLDARTGRTGTAANGNLNATTDVSLLGTTGAQIGDNTIISAGRSAAGWGGAQVIQGQNSILSNGSILIDTLRQGAGSGDIIIGNNVSMTSHGGETLADGTTASGSITFKGSSTGSVFADGVNISLTAYGGDIAITTGDDLTFGTGASLVSLAKLNDAGGQRWIPSAWNYVPAYSGGRIVLFAGQWNYDGAVYGNWLVNARTGYNNVGWPDPGAFDQATNNFSIVRGGWFGVQVPQLSTKNSSFFNTGLADGGVIFLDPPQPGNGLVLNFANIFALAPPLVPGTPPPPPPVDGGTTPPTGGGAQGLPSLFNQVSSNSQRSGNVAANTVSSRDVEQIHLVLAPAKQATCSIPISLKAADARSNNQPWYVATGQCQLFLLEETEGTFILAQKGSTVKPAGGTNVEMDCGRMLAIADDSDATIYTPTAAVTIPAGSTAVIEQKSGGALRVTGLTGNAVVVRIHGASPIEAKSGVDVLVYGDTDQEELIPTDGLPRELLVESKLIATVGERSLYASVGKINLADLAEKEQLINCSHCQQERKKNRLARLKDDLIATKKNDLSLNSPERDDQPDQHGFIWKPVAELKRIAGHPVIRENLKTASLCYLPGVKCSLDDKSIYISDGEAIVSATTTSVVRCRNIVMQMQPGTVALVSCQNGLSKVVNLCDSGNPVRVSAGLKHATVGVGCEFLVSSKAESLSKGLHDGVTARRRAHTFKSGSLHLSSSEVSPVSVISNSRVLHDLFRSQSAADKQLIARILKLAACLSIVTYSHGRYEH